MSTRISEKIAIVTGGSRGIGRAISIELAQEGYYLFINYHKNDEAAEETLAHIQNTGGKGELAKFNIANREEVDPFMNDVTARYQNVDVLVNNAGITADDLFVMMSPEKWESVINLTLNGFYNMTKPALKRMIRNRSGSVVSISSVSGLIANRGQSNYSAAKAGLIAASRSVAAEVGRLGVRVNVVAPGPIETDMINNALADHIKNIIPMNRIGKPEEIAKVVRFLCSDDASYITGQVIPVNGGMC